MKLFLIRRVFIRFEDIMKTLEEAKKDLENFLIEHPHMIENQKKIDDILNRTPEEHRLVAILLMLIGSQNELLKALKDFNTIKTH